MAASTRPDSLSIVVTWRDRDELIQALPGLTGAARALGGELTVVNYGGDPVRLAPQIEAFRGGHLRVVDVEGERYFNKARAQNIGASYSTGSVIFFCDCDIVVDSAEVASLASEVASRGGIFATLKGVTESVQNSRRAGFVVRFGYELALKLANGRELKIVDHEEDANDGTRQAPGLLLVRRDDFVRVNGYNGRLHGWGWEDQDMIARLTLGAGLERVQRGHAVHISHDDVARTAHYPPARDRWESRDRMFRQALAFYDQGDLAGTYESDRAGLRHRERS